MVRLSERGLARQAASQATVTSSQDIEVAVAQSQEVIDQQLEQDIQNIRESEIVKIQRRIDSLQSGISGLQKAIHQRFQASKDTSRHEDKLANFEEQIGDLKQIQARVRAGEDISGSSAIEFTAAKGRINEARDRARSAANIARKDIIQKAKAAEKARQERTQFKGEQIVVSQLTPEQRLRVERDRARLRQSRQVEQKQAKEITGFVKPVTSEGFTGLENLQQKLSIEKGKVKTSRLRGEDPTFFGSFKELGIGAASSVVGAGVLLEKGGEVSKKAVTQPIKTSKAVGGFFKTGFEIVKEDPKGTAIFVSKVPKEVLKSVVKEAEAAPLIFAGEVVTDFLAGEALVKVGKKGVTAAQKTKAAIKGDLRPIETSPFGEKAIKDVPIGDIEVDIGLIPEGSSPKFKTDPLRAVTDTVIPFKETPSIPREQLSPVQQEILAVTKERGSKVSGSFAQEVLIEEDFARGFSDIDVLDVDPEAFAKELAPRIEGRATIQRQTITDAPGKDFDIFRVVEDGKVVGDIDPINLAEEGFAETFGTIEVEGIQFVGLESRLAAKVKQKSRNLRPVKRKKVLTDIELLTGGAEVQTGATTRGGFGFTQAEQAEFIGKEGIVTTSARDLFPRFKKEVTVKSGEGDLGLFFTPFDPKSLKPQTRISRLGVQEGKFSFVDLAIDGLSFKREKPQIVLLPGQKIGDEILPFGFKGSSELEVTLPPGKILKKTKKRGVTFIGGKKVQIIETEIATSSKELSKLQTLSSGKKLTSKQLKRQKSLLQKETGLRVSKPLEPRIEIGGTDIFGRATTRIKPSTRTPSLFTSPKPRKKPRKPSKTLTLSSLSRGLSLPSGLPSLLPPSQPSSTISITRRGTPSFPPSTPPSLPPSTPPSLPPSTPSTLPPSTPSKTPKLFPSLSLLTTSTITKGQGYNVFVKDIIRVKGKPRVTKFKRINKTPLTRSSALDLGADVVDNSTAQTFEIRKSTKKASKPTPGDGYFGLTRHKFRQTFLRKGKTLPLPNRFIEKRRFAIDKIGEVRDLSASKYLKQRSKPFIDISFKAPKPRSRKKTKKKKTKRRSKKK